MIIKLILQPALLHFSPTKTRLAWIILPVDYYLSGEQGYSHRTVLRAFKRWSVSNKENFVLFKANTPQKNLIRQWSKGTPFTVTPAKCSDGTWIQFDARLCG